MQNIVWKFILIFAVVALCLYSVYPPEERIRLGKDLRGGTSLIYLVNIPDEVGNKQELLIQTIDVLQNRVNPKGILEISMAPLGSDRIEVTMPLATPEVLALREEYNKALRELVNAAEIRPDELDESLRFGTAANKFSGSAASSAQGQMYALQTAYNELQEKRQQLTEARNRNADAAEIDQLEQAVADAQYTYETVRAAVLRLNLDEARVVRTLNLPTQETKPAPGTEAQADTRSQREIALSNLKTEFAHLSDLIEKTVVAFDRYQAKRTTLDDPEDLMRLLRGAGVLEFYIAVRNSSPQGVNIQELRDQLQRFGPDNTDSPNAKWFRVNELKQWARTAPQLESLQANPEAYFAAAPWDLVAARFDADYYLLLYTSPQKSLQRVPGVQWAVERTGRTTDDFGRPAVSFQLDAPGGQMMSRLTGQNVNQPMAIVLDGQVYSAPNIQTQIGNSGVITGEFSRTELDYLTRVLAAGALEARLSENPIALNTLGPSLGRDNLEKGREAVILSIIGTAVLMVAYYFFAGFVAVIALLLNAVIIFGLMAMQNATFTLPGLAGIALSIGMAVDANVLIYERIREELINNKEDLRTAIRLGYNKALSAIVDGNLTNLIVCVVLYNTATTEVKGFALTLGLGIVATLFTALFCTRQIYYLYTDYFKIKNLPMLPTVFPGIHRTLEPSINWIGKRHIFAAISAVFVIGSLVLVWTRGADMLDTEFRGGLTMTMQTRLEDPEDPTGPRILLARPEVEAQIRQIGEEAALSDPDLAQLRTASVLTLGEATPDFRSSRFQIKVAAPPQAREDETMTDKVVKAIARKLGDLEVTPPLEFTGSDDSNHTTYTHIIDEPTLGAVIGRSQLGQSVEEYRGGVAVVVNDIRPPITTEAARARVDRLRQQPDFASIRARETRVIGLDPVDPSNPARGFTSLAILVRDPALAARAVDFEVWDRDLAMREWQLVSDALKSGRSMQEVSSFSPAVAKTLAASAVVAVALSLLGMLIYIWVRFGSARYSLSAIVALAHDVTICLGALALTHALAGTKFANFILLDEFRIDLNVIAALLTIIGYSLNDTIVILDRVRENRGRRLAVTPEIVNTSINQTFSRTILTGGTTIVAVVILYILGGTGIQPFAFTFLIGLLVGTYSSVAIAAPMVVQKPPPPGTAIEPVVLDRPPSSTAVPA